MWLQKLLLVGLFIGLLQVTSILCQSTLPDYVKQQRTPYYQSKSSRELGCRAKYSDPNRATLHCLESFLEEQIHTHGSKEYKMPQTFRVGWDYHPSIKGVPADFGYKLSMRSDSYDTALTAMFLIHQNRIELARKIVDSIVFAINNDPIGDGRTRAAYYVDDNVASETEAPIPSFFSKIFDPSVQTRALAMQANTLIRFYLHTKEYQYLKGALKIANFIEKNLWAVKSTICGYYGGLDKDGELIGARFTADNAGIYSLAKNIYAVTKEPKWQVMEDCAKRFVRNMFDQKLGTYMAQTENEKDSDEFVKDRITTDAIVWIALTDIDTEERIASALNYMMENMLTVEEQRNEYGRTKTYRGMKYSNSGSGWVGESSTGAAFALSAFADKHAANPHSNRFKVQAKDILTSLYDAQGDAMNSDGHCLVASLRDDGSKAWYGNEFAGESFRIYPLCHSAATSWLGLYVQYTFMHDYFANPFNIYADKHIDIKDVEPYYQAPAIGYTAFEKLSIASLVIGLLLAGLSLCVVGNIVVLNLAVFGIAGASLYQNNKVTDWFKNYVKLPSDKIPLKDDDALELGAREKTPDSPAMTDSAQETGNETRRMLPLRKAIANRISRLSTPASPRGSGSRPMTPVEIEHKSSSSNLVFSPNDNL